MSKYKFIDLFAGLGGFRVAFEQWCKETNNLSECVFVSEIDKEVIKTYKGNFKQKEKIINIRDVDESCSQIPIHDILFGGFPCQAFSNAGHKMGFLDKTRGTLFFDIAKILKQKKPKYFLLENVKHLVKHNSGNTYKTICETLKRIGYIIPEKPLILSPHQFGVPQERWRVYIPGVLKNNTKNKFVSLDVSPYFEKLPSKKQIINNFLEKKVDGKFYLSIENRKDKYIIDVLNAWNELIKNIKLPIGRTIPVIWLYSWRNPLIKKEYPEWKIKYLKDMHEIYLMNKKFCDMWMKKWNVEKWAKREQKFEWQAGSEIKDIKETIITFRQSGIRCKKFQKFPTLVAMVQTTLIYDYFKNKWRHITPRENANLQSFPKKYKTYDQIVKNGKVFYSYKQFGNSINVKVVNIVIKELMEKY